MYQKFQLEKDKFYFKIKAWTSKRWMVAIGKNVKGKMQYFIVLKNETLGKYQSIYSELCIGIILTFIDLFSLAIHIYFKTGAK